MGFDDACLRWLSAIDETPCSERPVMAASKLLTCLSGWAPSTTRPDYLEGSGPKQIATARFAKMAEQRAASPTGCQALAQLDDASLATSMTLASLVSVSTPTASFASIAAVRVVSSAWISMMPILAPASARQCANAHCHTRAHQAAAAGVLRSRTHLADDRRQARHCFIDLLACDRQGRHETQQVRARRVEQQPMLARNAHHLRRTVALEVERQQ